MLRGDMLDQVDDSQTIQGVQNQRYPRPVGACPLRAPVVPREVLPRSGPYGHAKSVSARQESNDVKQG